MLEVMIRASGADDVAGPGPEFRKLRFLMIANIQQDPRYRFPVHWPLCLLAGETIRRLLTPFLPKQWAVSDSTC